jgi:hypothetical protein
MAAEREKLGKIADGYHFPQNSGELLGKIEGGDMEKYAVHLSLALNLFESTDPKGIPDGIKIDKPYKLFATLQSCGGHEAEDRTEYCEWFHKKYNHDPIWLLQPYVHIRLPTVLYQSPNNSLLEGAIGKMQLDLCSYPVGCVQNGDIKYSNNEYLKKREEFQKENKNELRTQIVGGGRAQTIVCRNNFPLYSLQKKEIRDPEKEKYNASDLASVRLDFLKLAEYLSMNYYPSFYDEFRGEMTQLQLDLSRQLEKR